VPEGVCQVAAVEEVAVKTWPAVGAVAEDTFIAVVALFKIFAAMLFVVLVRVLFVKVSVVVLATKVSVMSGNVSDLLAVCESTKVMVVAVVAPESAQECFLVVSVPSTM